MRDPITIADVFLEDRSQYPVIVPFIATAPISIYSLFTVGNCPYGWVVTKSNVRVSIPTHFCRHSWHDRNDYQRKRWLRRNGNGKYTEMKFHRFRMEEGIGGRLIMPSELRVADGHLLLTAEMCISPDLKNHYRVKQMIVMDYLHLPA